MDLRRRPRGNRTPNFGLRSQILKPLSNSVGHLPFLETDLFKDVICMFYKVWTKLNYILKKQIKREHRVLSPARGHIGWLYSQDSQCRIKLPTSNHWALQPAIIIMCVQVTSDLMVILFILFTGRKYSKIVYHSLLGMYLLNQWDWHKYWLILQR